MSFPTDKFSKLSLGTMPTTRSQGLLSQSGRDAAEDDNSESEMPEAPSRLIYDQRDLSPGAQERLMAAFEGRFIVECCSEIDDSSDRGTYFAFQLAETKAHTVRIWAPGSEYSNVECSNCNEPQPCRHIFWLLDQINKHTLSDAQKRGSLTLSKRGYPAEVPEPFSRISKVGMETLAESAHWEFRPPPYTEPDRDAKAEEIKEIMAALSPSIADEYRPDIFDHLAVIQSFETALAQQDLPALVAMSMMVNQDMFHHFRAIVSPSYCAADFFKKMGQKADDSLALMTEYLQSGSAVVTNETPDIPWCARTLINIVSVIRDKILRSTLSKPAKAEAGNTLVHILDEVVNRNINAYSGAIWDRTPQRKLPDRDNNLFHRLIVAPTRSADPPFIIHELNYLIDSTQHLVDHMEAIGEQMPKGGAPSTYTAKFRELLSRMKRDQSSGSKRPGGEMSRDPKRAK